MLFQIESMETVVAPGKLGDFFQGLWDGFWGNEKK